MADQLKENSKPFEMDEDDTIDDADGVVACKLLSKNAFNPKVYDTPSDRPDGFEKLPTIRSTEALVRHLESEAGTNTEIEARIICRETSGEHKGQTTERILDKEQFLEQWKKGQEVKHFREGLKYFQEDFDGFGDDGVSGGGPFIGQDFVPLLSGPFYKQLYYYDYLKMHALSFHAYHHDGFAKRGINCIVEFVLGKGFKIQFKDDKDAAAWDAFDRANKFQQMFRRIFLELLVFGEQMIWKLPDHEKYIGYKLSPSQQPPKVPIQRIRQIDPSVIWEIVTYPEDITRVLYYQWVAPTQYQIYTGEDQGDHVPGSKFIMQQIPADQILHFKINCMSDEKRGRSVLFAALGDLKRLRDTLDYGIAALQKASAWAIDTTVEGSQADLDNYVRAQQQMGPQPPAASEFAHTKKIVREYLGNSHTSAGGGDNKAFDWALSRFCATIGVPINYMGVHTGGSSTRASAMVQTEPVDKTFEYYQQVCEEMIRSIAKEFVGINGDMEVTFPELVSQDRSAKIRDIMTAERAEYISKERAATMAAKELSITDYDYNSEEEDIQSEGGPDLSLLTLPGAGGAPKDDGGGSSSPPGLPKQEEPEPSGLTDQDRRAVSMGRGQ